MNTVNKTILPIILFVGGTLFAGVHSFAVAASLYWFYWWFDIMMHFWGGILVAISFFVLTSFKKINVRPSLALMLIVLALTTGLWEVFEYSIGVLSQGVYIVDTVQDVLIGFCGGLLAFFTLQSFRMDR